MTTFIDNMAGVLGIHKADIKVVAVYEGSVIVDFEVIENLFSPSPVELATVAKVFVEVASTLDEFMGAPVLNAIGAAAELIVTPNTPLNEDGTVFTDFVNLWDEPVDPNVPVFEDEPKVKVEVRYKVQDSDDSVRQGIESATRLGFIAIIVCIVVIVGLVIFAICLYRKITASEQVDKAYVPDNVTCRDEFEDMRGLEEQYTPGKNFKENLGRPPKSARKNEDSLASLAGLSTIRKGNALSKSKTEDLFSYGEKADNVHYTPDSSPQVSIDRSLTKKRTTKKSLV